MHCRAALILLLACCAMWGQQRIHTSSLNNRHAVPAKGLVAAYDYTEGTGQVLGDRTLNALHGELGTTAGSETEDPVWVAGGCLDFTAGDYIRLPQDNRLLFEETNFSVIVQFSTSSGTAATVISRGGSTTAAPRGGWRFSHLGTSSGNVFTTVTSAGGVAYTRGITTGMTLGNRYVFGVAGMYRTAAATSSMQIYRDGVSRTSTDAGSATNAGANSGLKPIIGGNSYGTDSANVSASFVGRMCATLFYSRALTPSEHWQIWRALR